MIDHVYIFKSDVKDEESFINSINLHNCRLANRDDESTYYIIEGSPGDIECFRQDLNAQEGFGQ